MRNQWRDAGEELLHRAREHHALAEAAQRQYDAWRLAHAQWEAYVHYDRVCRQAASQQAFAEAYHRWTSQQWHTLAIAPPTQDPFGVVALQLHMGATGMAPPVEMLPTFPVATSTLHFVSDALDGHGHGHGHYTPSAACSPEPTIRPSPEAASHPFAAMYAPLDPVVMSTTAASLLAYKTGPRGGSRPRPAAWRRAAKPA